MCVIEFIIPIIAGVIVFITESFNFFIQRLDLVIEIQKFPYLDVNVNVPWPLI